MTATRLFGVIVMALVFIALAPIVAWPYVSSLTLSSSDFPDPPEVRIELTDRMYGRGAPVEGRVLIRGLDEARITSLRVVIHPAGVSQTLAPIGTARTDLPPAFVRSGEEIVIRFTWDRLRADGEAAPPGQYVVVASVGSEQHRASRGNAGSGGTQAQFELVGE